MTILFSIYDNKKVCQSLIVKDSLGIQMYYSFWAIAASHGAFLAEVIVEFCHFD
jgi:hypothetical protein